jgi:hypothetical protein
VTNELQEAAKTKINLSKTKLQTLRSEVRAVLDEIESVGKIMPA